MRNARLSRKAAAALLLLTSTGVLTRIRLEAQSTPSSQRTFDVVSIRESKDQSGGGQTSFPAGRIAIENVDLSMVIEFAYGLKPRGDQLVRLPDWARQTKYNIIATYGGPRASPPEAWAMVRMVLEERFRLVAHRETREGLIYELRLARADGKLGPRLTRSDIDCDKWRAEKRPILGGGGPSPLAPGGRRPQCDMLANGPIITAGAISIARLTEGLAFAVQTRVVDRTELTGRFDVDLEYTRTSELTGPTTDGVSIFTAIQEQLGLKLQAAKGPLEVLVIDSLQRPTPN
jgi:uncharacterized protein (TIGR03435 family)